MFLLYATAGTNVDKWVILGMRAEKMVLFCYRDFMFSFFFLYIPPAAVAAAAARCAAVPPVLFVFACSLKSVRRPNLAGNNYCQLTDLESELNALDTRGFSVLHYTCLHSLGALVPVLLQRGADVNLRTGDDQHQVRSTVKSARVWRPRGTAVGS